MDGVIAKAMAKRPEDRYATAGELAGDLGRALDVTGGEHVLLEPSNAHPRRRLIAGVGLVALAVLTIVLVLATRKGPSAKIPPATPIGVSRIDVTSSRVTLSTRDNRAGWDLLAAEGALWESGPDGLIKRNDTTGHIEKDNFPLGGQAQNISAGFGAIWVTVAVSPLERHLVRIDPATDEITANIDVSPAPSGQNDPTWLAIDHESVWVFGSDGTLWRIDPITDRIIEHRAVTTSGSSVTTGSGFVWVSNTLSDEVVRVDPSTGKEETISTSSRPDQLAFVGGTLWAMDVEGRTVTPIDASLLEAGAPVGIPKDPTEVVGGLGWLWISSNGQVSRIDPLSAGQIRQIPVGFAASAVAPDERTGTVWVSRQPDD